MFLKVILALIIVMIAYLAARHYNKQGYNFWRTFFMTILAEVGLIALLISVMSV